MKKGLLLPLLTLSLISCGQNITKDSATFEKKYENVSYIINFENRSCFVEVERTYVLSLNDLFYAPQRKSNVLDNEFYIYSGGSKLLVIYNTTLTYR